MTIKEAIESVLALQPKWTAANSTAMQERGELIRNELPTLLRPLCESTGLQVQGRDGTGLKTRVPWVRFFDPRFSLKATESWYIVFLFAFDGSGVFLSLNQGTTKLINGAFVARDPAVLTSHAQQARTVISNAGLNADGFLPSIELKDPEGLGAGYEHGNVLAMKYERGNIPQDETIKSDVLRLVPLLKSLYQASDTSQSKDT